MHKHYKVVTQFLKEQELLLIGAFGKPCVLGSKPPFASRNASPAHATTLARYLLFFSFALRLVSSLTGPLLEVASFSASFFPGCGGYDAASCLAIISSHYGRLASCLDSYFFLPWLVMKQCFFAFLGFRSLGEPFSYKILDFFTSYF